MIYIKHKIKTHFYHYLKENQKGGIVSFEKIEYIIIQFVHIEKIAIKYSTFSDSKHKDFFKHLIEDK